MLPLRLRSIAEAEIAETLDWYQDRSPAAAGGFLKALDQTLDRVRQNPTGFPQVSSTLRRALIPHYIPTGYTSASFPMSLAWWVLFTTGATPATGVAAGEV